MNQNIYFLAEMAKKSSAIVAGLSGQVKSSALKQAAKTLLLDADKILRANKIDVENARKNKLSASLIDRLTLTPDRVRGIAQALNQIAAWPDPIGEIVENRRASQGILLQKVRVPLGVVAMVYESRPNVTVEAAALCFKAGNAVILRGGKEAIQSNLALVQSLKRAFASQKIPKDAVTFIKNTDRKNIYELASLDGLIDLLIARGSEKMVQEIRRVASVPVLGHGKGVCHVYVDKKANLAMALSIAFNAKVQRPSVCNAMESLLVHKNIAAKFLPKIAELYQKSNVIIWGDAAVCKAISFARKATEKNWSQEYHDLALSMKVVPNLDAAIEHIQKYSSGHTESIVTDDTTAAKIFLRKVDSAAVFHNISTRMHDGGVFGLGAEIGISTQKLHARGAMGVRELTSTKYVATGHGQIRK